MGILYFFSPPAAGAAAAGAAAGAAGAAEAPGGPCAPPDLAAAAASRTFLSAMPWLLKMRVSANSPSLCPTMFSEMYTGMCCLPLWTAIVSPTKSGRMVERRDHVFHQVVVHEWTLLNRASHGLALVSLLVPELDDHAARALVLARLVALGQHPPGAYRILPCRGLSLAAAMRVVDRIHRDPAHRGPDSAPAYAPGLADRFQAVLLVADFADGGAAIHVYFADLAGTQAHLGVAALAGEKLHRGAGRARELRAPTRLHLDAVNRGADRNVPERQRIARLDRRLHARQKLHSGREALGGDDVAAFAVGVTEQREVCAPVRIVFQPLDLRGDTVLVAAEIDDAVMLLVAPALVAHGDVAVDVAARLPRLLLDQRLVRPALVQVRVHQLNELPPAGRCGFDFDERHGLLRSLEVDFLPLGEG